MLRATLLSSLTPGTGNRVTIERIAQHVLSFGMLPSLKDPATASVHDTSSCDLVIGVHAFRSGTCCPARCILCGDLMEAREPSANLIRPKHILVLGGTDVNVYLQAGQEPAKR